MISDPNAAFEGIVIVVLKVPSLATIGRAMDGPEVPNRINTSLPGTHPLPVAVTTVPGGPEVGLSVIVGAACAWEWITFPPSGTAKAPANNTNVMSVKTTFDLK